MMTLKIRQYTKLSPRLFELLYEKFTYESGGIRRAIHESRTIKFFVAFLGKEVVGWAVLYDGFYCSTSDDSSVGVFVKESCRHCGIGNRLRKKALVWAVHKDMKPWWYNRHQAYMAYRVSDENMIPMTCALETTEEQPSCSV